SANKPSHKIKDKHSATQEQDGGPYLKNQHSYFVHLMLTAGSFFPTWRLWNFKPMRWRADRDNIRIVSGYPSIIPKNNGHDLGLFPPTQNTRTVPRRRFDRLPTHRSQSS